MTNTANAPDRIWTADTTGNCSVGFNTPSLEYKNEYISSTHCDELVAAAYVDAAQRIEQCLWSHHWYIDGESVDPEDLSDGITKRTPDDARTALTAYGERMKAEGAKAAHEEAFARGANWAQEKARVEGRLVIVDSPELAKLRADLAEAQAKIARLTNALEEIADRHIPDQPAALDISEAEYVRRQHTELRRTARATLAEVRRFAGAALQENANG